MLFRSKVQFCWNGVTGTMAAFRDMGELINCASRSFYSKLQGVAVAVQTVDFGVWRHSTFLSVERVQK